MEQPFAFQEVDTVGEDTLDVISKADRFNKWMYQTIKPHCHGKVLEIGSGVGNISQFFLHDGFQIQLSDIRTGYCKRLDQTFRHYPSFLGVTLMDLTDPDFDEKFKHLLGTFDTVFALNVVEHIFDDELAIRNCHKLLRTGGSLIILVPAYQWLYNNFDKGLEHYRRYTISSLTALFEKSQFKIAHRQYFNFVGIFGWYVSGKLQRNDNIPEGQMSLYNRLVPIFKIVDKIIFNTMGLSAIVVGKKGIVVNVKG